MDNLFCNSFNSNPELDSGIFDGKSKNEVKLSRRLLPAA